MGPGKLGGTIVDSLDTLWIMNVSQEYEKGRDWVVANLSFDGLHHSISVFETNIRYVGGLLSAASLDGDVELLEKAVEVADHLVDAMDWREGGVPPGHWIIGRGVGRGIPSLAEIGTLNLEFVYLSRVTGDEKYEKHVRRIMEKIYEKETKHHFYPSSLRTNGR